MIKTLYLTSFKGMKKLKILNISGNKLSGKQALPKGVFAPMSASLHELDTRHNKMDTKAASLLIYPDEALADLTSLNVLKMDCITGQ